VRSKMGIKPNSHETLNGESENNEKLDGNFEGMDSIDNINKSLNVGILNEISDEIARAIIAISLGSLSLNSDKQKRQQDYLKIVIADLSQEIKNQTYQRLQEELNIIKKDLEKIRTSTIKRVDKNVD